LNVDRGFTATNVLAVNITLPRNVYFRAPQRVQFHDELQQRLARVTQVNSVAVTSFMPLEGEMQVDMLSLENDTRPMTARPSTNMRYVSPTYFRTLGIPITQGRAFDESDRTRRSVVLSEHAARQLWPGENPIGKRVVPGSNDSIAEVVGVVADVKTTGLEQPGSNITYLPYWQRPPVEATLLISTNGDPRALIGSVRSAIAEVGPVVPISRVRTMEQIVSTAVAPRRFQLLLMSLFAVCALVTASVGIYGIISHALARRANEIGVRMALGANPAQVHRLVLREVMRPVVYGLTAGVALSAAFGQTFRALLFDVGVGDWPTMVAVAGILVTVATVACYVPARRSTRGGVVAALRAE
jgi:predicted permease